MSSRATVERRSDGVTLVTCRFKTLGGGVIAALVRPSCAALVEAVEWVERRASQVDVETELAEAAERRSQN